MAIDPTTTTTVKVSELASAGYNTTDLIPHEVAGILKKGNLQDLATFIGSIIDVEGSVGFRAVNVTDGQTLPATTEEEFILVGPGTFPNVGGGSAITTTEPLNALVSNGTYWFIGVEIPIAASGAWGSIEGNIETQTDLQDALDLKADLVDGKVPASQLPSYVDDVVEVANFAALPATGETGKIYITIDTNKVYRWSGSAYIEIAENNAVWGLIEGTLSSQTDLQNALNAKEGTITAGTTSQYWRGDKSWQTLNKAAVGLGNVDNTSDLNKPISTATQTALNGKFNNPTGDTTQYIAGDGSLVSFPIAGQAGTIVREVRNTTGATLTKGTIVYISGATGNKPTVSKAIATGDSTSAQTFGMVQADLANNSNGYVVCVGDITGLNTSALTEGAQLYLSSTTAGTYTTTKQLAPAHLVYIGVVTRSHATQGQIEVKIQNGYELDEIHDVAISSVANNQVLVYESATSLWKNKSISTVLGYTPQAQLSGTGFVKASGTTISYDNSTYVPTSRTITINGVAWNLSTDISYTVGGIWGGITGTLSSQTDLQAALDAKQAALNGTGFVKISGTTISYDNSTYALDSAVVKVTTDQNVRGIKTFLGNQTATTLKLIVADYYNDGFITSDNGMLRLLNGTTELFNLASTGDLTAKSFVKSGGTSSQYLMADGSVSTGSGGTVTGTGTTNTIPKFTSSTAIGNSNITDNGTVVAISTDATINGVNIGKGLASLANNIRIGGATLLNVTTGDSNVAISSNALQLNTTGASNIAIGRVSMLNNTTGFYNVAVGRSSLGANTTGYQNTAIGGLSLGSNTTGVNNVSLGYNSLTNLSSGNTNVSLGESAGRYIANGTTSLTIANNSIFIGSNTKALADSQTNQIVIGHGATGLGSNTTVLGNSSTTTTAIYGNVLIGTTTDAGYKLDVNGAIRAAQSITIGTGGSYTEGSIYSDANWGMIFRAKQASPPNAQFMWADSADNELMRIKEGNLAIGTATPLLTNSNRGSVTINGSLSSILTLGIAGSYSGYLYSDSTKLELSSATQPLTIVTNGSERMRITSGGNVGIGTTSPGTNLHVQGSGSYAGVRIANTGTTGGGFMALYQNNVQSAFIGVAGAWYGNTDSNLGIAADTGKNIQFFTDGTATPKAIITSGGNVLIGTTTDSGAKLKVGSGSGPVATPTYLQMDSTYANAATPTNQQLKIYLDKVSSTESYGFATSNDAGLFYHSGGVGFGYHAFCTSGTERMRIANNGAITATSTITASGGFFNSDIRLKDLTDYDYNVSDIKPITYLWKDGRDKKKHVGYSAQEVQKVMPDAVNEDEKGFLSVNYVEVLVAKIAELENRIKQLEK